jgi:hypothetical protein
MVEDVIDGEICCSALGGKCVAHPHPFEGPNGGGGATTRVEVSIQRMLSCWDAPRPPSGMWVCWDINSVTTFVFQL